MATTFTNIYVDLERTTSANTIIDSNGVATCDTFTKTGSRTNPLNFVQFREYLLFDHEVDQTFYLNGKVSLDITDSSDKGELGKNILFETPHANHNIRITRWDDSLVEVNEPWHITVTSTDNVETIFIYTNNDNVSIENGEIEVSGAPDRLTFGIDYFADTSDIFIEALDNPLVNTLKLVNNKFYANQTATLSANDHTYIISNYKNVELYNNLFNNRTSAGSFEIINDQIGNTNNFFVNNVFVRLTEFVAYPDDPTRRELLGISPSDVSFVFSAYEVSLSANNTVLTESQSGVSDYPGTGYYNLFQFIDNDVTQFDFSAPSACGEDLNTLDQSVNFNYVDDDWIQIDISGNSEVNRYADIGTSFTSVRDGLGPLTFRKLPSVQLSANPNPATEGSPTEFINRDLTYDATYVPSEYIWTFGADTSSTSGGVVSHTYSTVGTEKVLTDIVSHNEWYFIETEFSIRILFGSRSDGFRLDAFKVSADCFDSFLVSASSADTFDTVILSAVNLSTEDPDSMIYNSWGADFSDCNGSTGKSRGESYRNIAFGTFGKPGGTALALHQYMSSGERLLHFGAQRVDGLIDYEDVPVFVQTRESDEYYCDFALNDSTKWLKKDTGIEDDFETGSFDAGWYSDFTDKFSVSSVYDQFAALSSGGSVSADLTGEDVYYNFDFEFSFVRTNRDDIPAFHITSGGGISSVLKVEWLYNRDQIKFTAFGEEFIENYKLFDHGLVKDLRCKQSLRELEIRLYHISYEEFGTGLEIWYKIGNDWIKSEHSHKVNIEGSAKRLRLFAEGTADVGFGYFKLQSKCGFPYSNGSTLYPYTYPEFKYKVSPFQPETILSGVSVGDYRDRYLCRNNYRDDELFHIDETKFYEVDAWDLSAYGPWMITFTKHVDKTVPVHPSHEISFVTAKLLNGIIHNTVAEEIPGSPQYMPPLRLSFVCNMWVVWQGISDSESVYNRVTFRESRHVERDRFYIDIFGSTMKSTNGFLIYGDNIE